MPAKVKKNFPQSSWKNQPKGDTAASISIARLIKAHAWCVAIKLNLSNLFDNADIPACIKNYSRAEGEAHQIRLRSSL